MTEELIKQIYGGELTAEATKLIKYIYAGAQPIEDNDFALMFGRMNLAKFVEVKAKEDEIIAKQGKKLKEEHHKTNSKLSTELQEARNYMNDMEQEIGELKSAADILSKNLRDEQEISNKLQQDKVAAQLEVKNQEKTITNLMSKLAKKSEAATELEKTVEKQQQIMEHENELRGEIEVLQNKFNMKCNDIVEKNNTIDELKAEREELRAKVDTYKMDNFDLQADNDRLRHQLEAIKNIIAL